MSDQKPTVRNSKSSKKRNASNASARVSITRAQSFSGPIPPPALFGAYEQVLPGSADRILSLAEREQRQRHHVQKEVVMANVKAERQGMLYGFIFQLFVIGGLYIIAAILLIKGKDLSGLIALFTALAGSGGVFIYQNRSHKDGPKDKSKK